MGNILVSLDADIEQRLRRLAREDFGGKKGALSQAVAQGVLVLDAQNERRRLVAQAIHDLRTIKGHSGLKPGERFYRERGELYDR